MEGCSEIWDFVVEVQRHFRGKSMSLSTSLLACHSRRSNLTTAALSYLKAKQTQIPPLVQDWVIHSRA